MQQELDVLLLKQEMLWKDKAKANWNEQGDTNTHFFHLSTIIHRNNNRICRILSCQNEWITQRTAIGNAFENYFSHLFTTVSPALSCDMQVLIPSRISATTNHHLASIPLSVEIKSTVFGMGTYKSPRPDGLTTTFFKHYWNIVGVDVSLAVQEFFRTEEL